MIKCVIIDDEQPAINVLKKYISRIDHLELAGVATDPIAGIELVRNCRPDVLFLDIQMDEMSGIEVIKILGSTVQVIFCTAFSEFAVTSYDLDAVDYLMKPIAFSRFVKAINRIKSKESTEIKNIDISDDYIFVKTEHKGKLIRISLADIDFVEARSNYIAIHRGHSKTMVYSSLRDFEQRLHSSRFIRIHKSYIIDSYKIAHVENNAILLKNRTERIPLSKTYKAGFLDQIKNRLLL